MTNVMRGAVAMAAVVLVARAAMAQNVTQHLALGDSAQLAFRAAEALEHYEAAIAADSGNADAWSKASRTAVDLGESEEDVERRRELFRLGVQYARHAVAIDSANATHLFNLARALGRTALSVGVRDRVRYAVEIRDLALAALALDPDHPGALHVLGMWHAEVKRLSGIQRFFAERFLGGGVFRQANWNDAVRYLERAVAVDPQRLVHHLDLGKIYVDVGDSAKAREQFEFVINAARQTDVNDPLYKRQAQEALERLG